MHKRLEQECAGAAHGVVQRCEAVPTAQADDGGRKGFLHGGINSLFPVSPAVQRTARCIQVDGGLVLGDVEVEADIRIDPFHIGPVVILVPEAVHYGIFQDQRCILGVVDYAVGYVCGDHKGVLQREYLGPGYGPGGFIEVIGAVAVKGQQGSKNPAYDPGSVIDAVEGLIVRGKIQPAERWLYVLCTETGQFFNTQFIHPVSDLGEKPVAHLIVVYHFCQVPFFMA